MIVVLFLLVLTAYFAIGMSIENRLRRKLDGFEPIIIIYFWPIIMIGCAIFIVFRGIKKIIKYIKEKL